MRVEEAAAGATPLLTKGELRSEMEAPEHPRGRMLKRVSRART